MTMSHSNKPPKPPQADDVRPRIPDDVLDRLDYQAISRLRDAEQPNNRAYARYRYRHGPVTLILYYAVHRESLRWVQTRNISQGGIAVLDHAPVMLDTRCRLMLPEVDSKPRMIDGVIRSCRAVEFKYSRSGSRLLGRWTLRCSSRSMMRRWCGRVEPTPTNKALREPTECGGFALLPHNPRWYSRPTNSVG